MGFLDDVFMVARIQDVKFGFSISRSPCFWSFQVHKGEHVTHHDDQTCQTNKWNKNPPPNLFLSLAYPCCPVPGFKNRKEAHRSLLYPSFMPHPRREEPWPRPYLCPHRHADSIKIESSDSHPNRAAFHGPAWTRPSQGYGCHRGRVNEPQLITGMF